MLPTNKLTNIQAYTGKFLSSLSPQLCGSGFETSLWHVIKHIVDTAIENPNKITEVFATEERIRGKSFGSGKRSHTTNKGQWIIGVH